MRITVISLFTEMFDALRYGITGRALADELIDLHLVNPRQFSRNQYRQVDDRPYGGGPGMVMMAQPLCDAIESVKQERENRITRTVYLSPQGKPIDQNLLLERVERQEDLILLAGRYEGIDERVINSACDEEWSLGDMVLSGGEIAAMAVIDGIIRLIPGALGNQQSATHDSFMDGLLDHPHYTRPELFRDQVVPPVLLQGNHEAIRQWRMKQALGLTWLKRPDLLAQKTLTAEQQQLLDEFKRDSMQSQK